MGIEKDFSLFLGPERTGEKTICRPQIVFKDRGLNIEAHINASKKPHWIGGAVKSYIEYDLKKRKTYFYSYGPEFELFYQETGGRYVYQLENIELYFKRHFLTTLERQKTDLEKIGRYRFIITTTDELQAPGRVHCDFRF